MDKERIRDQASTLPKLPLGREPVGDEAWEGDENGAHFIFSRSRIPVNQLSIFVLSTSGEQEGIKGLRSDFSEALGRPDNTSMEPGLPGIIFDSWIAEGVEKRLGK